MKFKSANYVSHSLVDMFQASTPSPGAGGAPKLPISYEAENFVSTSAERDNYEENYSKERRIDSCGYYDVLVEIFVFHENTK